MKPIRVGLFGHGDARHLDESSIKWVEDLGVAIARRGLSLYTGGGGGVMRLARKGFVEGGGEPVSLVPEGHAVGEEADEFLGSYVATGQGKVGRSVLLSQSIQLGIAVGGGAGTLFEVTACYLLAVPTIVVDGFQAKNDPGIPDMLTRTKERLVGGKPVLVGFLDKKEVGNVFPVHVCTRDITIPGVLELAAGLLAEVSGS